MERELPEGISPTPPPTGCQQLSETFLLVSTATSRPGFLCVSFGPITKFSSSIWRRIPSPEELQSAEKNHPKGQECSEVDGERQMRSPGAGGVGGHGYLPLQGPLGERKGPVPGGRFLTVPPLHSRVLVPTEENSGVGGGGRV